VVNSAAMSRPGRASWGSDERLVGECLKGNQDAWSALLQKYRNLIYSIPLKHGLSQDAASDILQQTCVQLLRHLGTLRDYGSLAAWLIKVTTRLCFLWSSQERRFEPSDMDTDWGAAPPLPEQVLRELEEEQLLRDAIASLKPRCRELVRMLFFETPAVSYAAVAEKLGLAMGSIGFVRMRCLRMLRRQLEQSGFV
jgi:RNA polymerase sigma factor (sigma-70 family)